VADSSSSSHLSQVGSPVNPSLKRCPFRWQCPVNSPTIHLNWYLFNFNRSFVLLAEGPHVSPFACLSPVVDSHSHWCSSSTWLLSWQLQLRCRKLVQVLWMDVQILFFQLICRFVTNNTLMTWYPYQLNSVMFRQLYEELVAVPGQVWDDLVFTMCFNCSLTDRI
jgi:hypothetical protein